MVEAALGQRLRPNELAGSEMHEKSGGIDLLVADEHAAIDAAKRYLAYYDTDLGKGGRGCRPGCAGAGHGRRL